MTRPGNHKHSYYIVVDVSATLEKEINHHSVDAKTRYA